MVQVTKLILVKRITLKHTFKKSIWFETYILKEQEVPKSKCEINLMFQMLNCILFTIKRKYII